MMAMVPKLELGRDDCHVATPTFRKFSMLLLTFLQILLSSLQSVSCGENALTLSVEDFMKVAVIDLMKLPFSDLGL